jgi:hypothetical protein
MRRVIRLLSVGGVPPYLGPAGACLTLGSRMPEGSPNAVEGYTTPGLRLFPCPQETFCVRGERVICLLA